MADFIPVTCDTSSNWGLWYHHYCIHFTSQNKHQNDLNQRKRWTKKNLKFLQKQRGKPWHGKKNSLASFRRPIVQNLGGYLLSTYLIFQVSPHLLQPTAGKQSQFLLEKKILILHFFLQVIQSYWYSFFLVQNPSKQINVKKKLVGKNPTVIYLQYL